MIYGIQILQAEDNIKFPYFMQIYLQKLNEIFIVISLESPKTKRF